MAGRIKHMERSHRSHRMNEGVFNNFHRRAYEIRFTKQQRVSLAQRFASLMTPVKNTLKKAID